MSDPKHLRSAVTMVMVKFSGGRNHQGFDTKPHTVMDGQIVMHVTEQVGGLLPGSTHCGRTPKRPSTWSSINKRWWLSFTAPTAWLLTASRYTLNCRHRHVWKLGSLRGSGRCSLFENPPEHHTTTWPLVAELQDDGTSLDSIETSFLLAAPSR